jgi:hypothetical protein
VKAAAVRFLVLMGVCSGLAAAGKLGLIEATLAQRAVGALIGLMVVIVGNAVPKLRPLSAPSPTPRSALGTERFAGWVLVVAGLAQVALFLLAPLGTARVSSGAVGGVALLAIAVNWVMLGLRGRLRSEPESELAAEAGPGAIGRARLKLWLFVGFLYVLLTSITAVLFNEKPWAHTFASGMVVAFALLWAILFAYVERKRPRK